MPSIVVVVLASAVLVAALGWYFFGPRRAGAARLEGGVQRVEVTVRGGYSPDMIKVRQGTPVELVFDRQEAGECTSRVVFPDLTLLRPPRSLAPPTHRGRVAFSDARARGS